MAAKKRTKKSLMAQLTSPEMKQAETDFKRDHFAMAALTGLCATRTQHKIELIGDMAPELAATSYLIADYMLKMRKYSSKDIEAFVESRKPKNV